MPAEARQQLFPSRDHRVHVARAGVLAVLPGGAEVTLHDPLVAVRADGVTQSLAHRRIGHPAIHNADAPLRSEIHQTRNHLLVVARHSLRAEADLADLKPRPAQTPVVHGTPLLRLIPYPYPTRRKPCRDASATRLLPRRHCKGDSHNRAKRAASCRREGIECHLLTACKHGPPVAERKNPLFDHKNACLGKRKPGPCRI